MYCLNDLSKCYNSTQWVLFNRNSRWNCTSLSYPLGNHTLERDDRTLAFFVGGRELKSQIKEMQIYRITLWGLYKVHFLPVSTTPYPGLPMHCLVRISSYSSGRITIILASVLKYINLLLKLKSSWSGIHRIFQNLSLISWHPYGLLNECPWDTGKGGEQWQVPVGRLE